MGPWKEQMATWTVVWPVAKSLIPDPPCAKPLNIFSFEFLVQIIASFLIYGSLEYFFPNPPEPEVPVRHASDPESQISEKSREQSDSKSKSVQSNNQDAAALTKSASEVASTPNGSLFKPKRSSRLAWFRGWKWLRFFKFSVLALTWSRWFILVKPFLNKHGIALAPDRNLHHIEKINVPLVLTRNLEAVKHSWEHGVLTHALLELQNPEVTVFAGPGYGIDLRNPFPTGETDGNAKVGAGLDAFPNGKLPKCGRENSGGGSAGWGRYDEWTRIKGLRYAATQIETGQASSNPAQAILGGDQKRLNQESWLYRAGPSAADAASLGWTALLLERAEADDPTTPVALGRNAYGEAADMMVRYLFEENVKFEFDYDGPTQQTPLREVGASDGRQWAISHRVGSPQLWTDFVFMVPPFLAAYAVARQDERWLFEAVEQIRAYKRGLATQLRHTVPADPLTDSWDSHKNQGYYTWKHIQRYPNSTCGTCCHDDGWWLTGNSWVLAGITRVYGVLKRWQPPEESAFKDASALTEYELRADQARRDLDDMAEDIVLLYRRMVSSCSGLLPMYVQLDTDKRSYPSDTAGTALFAASIYRLLQVDGFTGFTSDDKASAIKLADTLYNGVANRINKHGNLTSVTSTNEVPAKFTTFGTSEGQSFVLMMYAARRDCAKLGLCKAPKDPSWWRGLLEQIM